MTATHLPVPPVQVSRTREAVALGLISIGVVVTGPIGLVIGLVLVATSRRWSLPQKMLAVTVPAAIVGVLLLIGGSVGSYTCVQAGTAPEVCEPHAPVVIPVASLILLVVIAVGVPIYLFKAAKRL
jgi:hypothetical protein